jgi:hypothetical protein
LKKYIAYGLIIESEIDFPGFIETDKKPDVSVKIGKVPAQIDNYIAKGACFEAKPNEFLLKVLNIANFFVSNGNSILIEPAEGADSDSIRLFLLGSAFGALFHQLNLLPLHASVINLYGQAIAISGISGAGKSTLAAAFASKGYEIISDDIALIHFNNNVPHVTQGPRHVKLWNDSLKSLGLLSQKKGRIRKNIEKFFVPITGNSIKELPLRKIYILNIRNTPKIETSAIKGMEKFTVLRNHTYRINFVKGLGVENAHFELISKLAGSVDANRLFRSIKGFEVEKLMTLIINDLANQ